MDESTEPQEHDDIIQPVYTLASTSAFLLSHAKSTENSLNLFKERLSDTVLGPGPWKPLGAVDHAHLATSHSHGWEFLWVGPKDSTPSSSLFTHILETESQRK